MRNRFLLILWFAAWTGMSATPLAAAPESRPDFQWATVVNNGDLMPPAGVRHFNSYNQPSVNVHGTVVFRARSRGGPPLGKPVHGIYARDMSAQGEDIKCILDTTTTVPQPNNLVTAFVETPSFPRIDRDSATIATRGNHGPAWRYILEDGTETRGGTTGIYANPFGPLMTGASKLGNAPGFEHFRVPEFNGVPFDVFPGAPAVTGVNTIVFKGNYTAQGYAGTGVYFRILADDEYGGDSPAVLVANSSDTLIPGSYTVFGSVSPPSAADNHAVFSGFDNENAPTLGGIYLAPLQFQPPIIPLVRIGERVPGESAREQFSGLGEGGAFDGRHVGFWGSWGTATRTLRLYCPEEGNSDRIAYCNNELVCGDTGQVLGDPQSVCDDSTDRHFGERCYQEKTVPVNQGFFVHDTRTGNTQVVAKTGDRFSDFLFWNYSGKTPCAGSGHSGEGAEDDGEPVRWRSSAYVAVTGSVGATFRTAFKARTGVLVDHVYMDPVDGIYLANGPGRSPISTVLDTTTDGSKLDPEAPPGSTVTELGIEREALRGDWLAINASMGVAGDSEEDGMAGIYVTRIR